VACIAKYIWVSPTRLSSSLSCGPSLTCLAPAAPNSPKDLTPCVLSRAGLCCGLVYAVKVVWLGGLPTLYNRAVVASEGTPSILCHPSIVCPARALASLSIPSFLRLQTAACLTGCHDVPSVV
jgi:hypothetical protein